jgi:hypothetical protein
MLEDLVGNVLCLQAMHTQPTKVPAARTIHKFLVVHRIIINSDNDSSSSSSKLDIKNKDIVVDR